jgi:hypothetical protein
MTLNWSHDMADKADHRQDDTRDRLRDTTPDTHDLERALDASVERYRESQLRDQREHDAVADKAKAEADRRAVTDAARKDLDANLMRPHDCAGDPRTDVDLVLETKGTPDADQSSKRR